jgi:sulfite exporter TauE/SafE
MNAALSLSALLMGLASAPHCVAMCSSACGGVAKACGGDKPQHAMLALQVGRLLSYSAVGALAAASVATLGAWSSNTPALRPLWSAIHLAALLLGLWLVWQGQAPTWLRLFGQRVATAVQQRALSTRSTAGRLWQAGVLGSAWVALPCGLLQSALVVASLADGAVQGGAVMASFAIGSSVGLWAGPALWWRFSGGRLTAATGPATAARMGGAVLVGLSAWALGHGLWERLNPALC